MNPLYIDNLRVGLGVDGHSLYVKDLKTNKLIEKFEPRDIPYDSVFIQRPNGFVSFAALNWLTLHAVSLTILDWRGRVLTQFVPEQPIAPHLKVAQVQAYENKEKHIYIAKTLVQTKIWRQREFLKNLSQSYSVNVTELPKVNTNIEDFLRNIEARFATEYFTQFGSVCEQLGYRFKKRNQTKSNMHAADLGNGLLNYGYAILQTYVRRATNSIGLQDDIPFLHDLRTNRGLTFDLMELWRINVDNSVLETLKELKRSKKTTHYLTDGYEVMLEPSTVKTLFDRIKLNLSMEEILFNCRIFARFLLGVKKTLDFSLKPVQVKELFEQDQVKNAILTKTASQLGMNKSTLHYQRKRLEQTGSIRIYRKTRQYYV